MLMIAHEMPGDHRSDLDRASDTGKRRYFMLEKLAVMELWSNESADVFR
ncbi:hypothetical protein J4G43_042710 [Bradyrhizobium barranii subsp. barranii]|uniref:Uncharacterized protein n=1 Tax=Bradyrhizobium barranii subsp. barranii TaxID=2823807 RepID=A0A939S2Z7_9BRAD|nr:hypothetical protein [Bradyrhizobium barranii]UEM11233.1 hypothetical protein J4G43_042710 [Bradyrhizobium barranii subsp. barranii]